MVGAEAAGVVLHLLQELRVELLGGDALEDLRDHRPLVRFEEAVHRLVHDRPVRIDAEAPGIGPGEHDLLPLPGSEAVAERLDHRLGTPDFAGREIRGRCRALRHGKHRNRRRRARGGYQACLFEEVPPRQRVALGAEVLSWLVHGALPSIISPDRRITR